MSRNFRMALMISIGVHIFFMSAVVIINPAAREKIGSLTRVDFLGPLLKKTAFDIMLESANPVVRTSYSHLPLDSRIEPLEAAPPQRRVLAEELSRYYLDESAEVSILHFLADAKTIPAFLLNVVLTAGE